MIIIRQKIIQTIVPVQKVIVQTIIQMMRTNIVVGKQ